MICSASSTAQAITIENVEFTDFVTLAVPVLGDLDLSTSQDVYVFAPDPISARTIVFEGAEIIVFQSIAAETASFCIVPAVCEAGPLSLETDVVVNVLQPIRDLTVTAGGSIVVAAVPVPEPSSGLLACLGLVISAIARPRRRRSSGDLTSGVRVDGLAHRL